MQELWLCEACKSMNRSSSDRCYRCRAPRNRATVPTVATRQPGVVLTPGLDEEHRQLAWTLMLGRHYVSAWRLGYVAAAMLLLVVGAGALVVVAELGMMLAQGSLYACFNGVDYKGAIEKHPAALQKAFDLGQAVCDI